MFKIKLKTPTGTPSEDKKKKSLPRIKIAKPTPPSSSSSSKPKIKVKPLKLKLTDPKASSSITPSQLKVKKVPRIRVKPTRIPGEGYDSEASDIEDDPLIEEGIILRLLPDAELDYARHCVETGDFSKLHIKWKDRQRAVIFINHSMYAAKLVNLPNLIEAEKTVDRKNIFKTIDVTQILLAVKRIEHESEIESVEVSEKDVLDSGLTPPLLNVKHSQYRRKLNRERIEQLEEKVDELLRLDEEAEDSQYELIDPEVLNNISETASNVNTPGAHFESVASDINFDQTQDTSTSNQVDDLELELEQVLGEDGLFENGRPDGEEVEVEDEDEEEEVDEEEEQDEEDEEDDDDDDDDEDSENEQSAMSRKVEIDEDEQHNALLKDEINELLATIEQNKLKLSKASNPLLQSRFVDSISKLEKELENKKRQLKTSEDKTAAKDDRKEKEEELERDSRDDEDEDDDEGEEEGDGDVDVDGDDDGDADGDDDLDELFG